MLMKASGRNIVALLVAAALGSGATPIFASAQTGAGRARSKPVAPAGATPIGLPEGMMAPKAPRIPTSFDELFAERDARALDALAYLRCLKTTLRAIQTGVLGQVPRAWLLTCVEQEREWRGVFGELTDEAPGIRVHRQFALRGSGVVVSDPIDTARVNGVARALLRGLNAPLPGNGKYEFLPVPLPQATFIEVWFLPVPGKPTMAIVGGDSLIQMSSDGGRELGHSRSTSPIRTLSVSPGSGYTLASIEERIPLLSELMLAHMALSLAPDVRVRTNQYESQFTRGTTTVKHVRR